MQYIVTVRGTLKGSDENASKKLHDETSKVAETISKPLGNISHHPYLNTQNPREFFDIDVWESLEGIQKFFGDPKMGEVMSQLFEGRPEVTVYADKGWHRW